MDDRTRAQLSEMLKQVRAEGQARAREALRHVAREAGFAARRWLDDKVVSILEAGGEPTREQENDDE